MAGNAIKLIRGLLESFQEDYERVGNAARRG